MEYNAFRGLHYALLISLSRKSGLNFFSIIETCTMNADYRRGLEEIEAKMRVDFCLSQAEVIAMLKRHVTEMNEHVLQELKKIAQSKKARIVTQKRHPKGDKKAPLLN